MCLSVEGGQGGYWQLVKEGDEKVFAALRDGLALFIEYDLGQGKVVLYQRPTRLRLTYSKL